MDNKHSATDHWIQTPNGKIFARSWKPQNSYLADQDSTPILLFHDSLGCIQLWRQFPALLADATGRTVYAYDRLGFGQSEIQIKPSPISFIEDEARIYFPLICKQLGLETVILFGHSVGGAMAVNCASLYPELCEAVITESSQAFVEDRTVEGILAAKKNFAQPGEISKLEKYHGDKALWVLKAWTDVWLSTEFANWSLKEALPKVHCPVLAIHGDKDEFGSHLFPEMITHLAGGHSEMRLFENCGHVPHKEQTQVVLETVAQFLKSR